MGRATCPTHFLNPYIMKKTLYLWLLLCLIFGTACGKDSDTDNNIGGGSGGGNTDEPVKITPDAGITLYGYVGDKAGKPIAGVVMTDGFRCAVSSDKGVYQLVRNPRAKYVYISVPAGYNIPSAGAHFGNFPAFYAPATAVTGSSTTPHRVDFTLQRNTQDDKRFLLVGIGDPQPDNTEQATRFRNQTVNDINQLLRSETKPIVGVALGDIIGKGNAESFTLMKRQLGAIPFPVYVAIGNHDKSAVDHTGETFRNVMGPTHYSFNRGQVHFVCMDNIIFGTGDEYVGGFTDEQVAWLEEDLSFVDKSKAVVLYYHIPLRSNAHYRNYDRVLALVSKYAAVHLLSAHSHYFQPYKIQKYGLLERVHGAACGYFWRSACGGDGAPNGYMVYEFDGTRIVDSYFKGTQRPRDYQIRLYRGNGSFGGSYATYQYDLGANVIVANVFAAGMDGSDWKVELYEDGKFSGAMSKIADSYGDQWIRGYHIGVKHHSTGSGHSPCCHQYSGQLKNPTAQVEVRATDSFGHTYTQNVVTASNDFTDAIN